MDLCAFETLYVVFNNLCYDFLHYLQNFRLVQGQKGPRTKSPPIYISTKLFNYYSSNQVQYLFSHFQNEVFDCNTSGNNWDKK